jgi:hypothetical protein
VGEQDAANLEVFSLHECQQCFNLVARIDDDGLARLSAGDDKSVLEERPDGLRLD